MYLRAVLVFSSWGTLCLGAPHLLSYLPESCFPSWRGLLLPLLAREVPGSHLKRDEGRHLRSLQWISTHSPRSRRQGNRSAGTRAVSLRPPAPGCPLPTPSPPPPALGRVCGSLASNRGTVSHTRAPPVRRPQEKRHISSKILTTSSLSEKYSSHQIFMLLFAMKAHLLSLWSQWKEGPAFHTESLWT